MTTKQIPLLAQDDLVSVSDKVTKFVTMIDSIESLSDKKKELWKQIYTNAVIDRNHALICYNDLLGKALSNSTEHAIHAPNIAKYVSCMSKSNDQLIRLAEMVAEAEKNDDELNADNIYNAFKDDEK